MLQCRSMQNYSCLWSVLSAEERAGEGGKVLAIDQRYSEVSPAFRVQTRDGRRLKLEEEK